MFAEGFAVRRPRERAASSSPTGRSSTRTYNVHHCGRAERLRLRRPGRVSRADRGARSSPAPERKFVYAYWPEFDALSHRHGVGSAEVRAHFDGAGCRLRRAAGAPGGHRHDARTDRRPRLHRLPAGGIHRAARRARGACCASRSAASGASRSATCRSRSASSRRRQRILRRSRGRPPEPGAAGRGLVRHRPRRIRVSRSESATWRLS